MNIDFQTLRDQWALKWPYSKDSVDLQRNLDRNANPHNDGPPKRPRREDSQIISDLCRISLLMKYWSNSTVLSIIAGGVSTTMKYWASRG